MKWLINWWRVITGHNCPPQDRRPQTNLAPAADAQARAEANRRADQALESAEQALAAAQRQGPEVSAVAGRLRRARGDDFARLMTDAMRGT